MRFERWATVAVVASACAKTQDDGIIEGPPGDMPSTCVESSRSPVTDPTVPSEGMGFAAADAVALVDGDLVGELVSYDADGAEAGRTPLALTLVVGSIDRVERTLVNPPDGSDMGAPDVACDPIYELHAVASLSTEDGRLADDFDVVIPVLALDGLALHGHLPLADVHGTLAPVSIDPAAWDAVMVGLDASLDASGWTGSVGIYASREAEETFDTATGTGTIEPSGMSETVGTFQAHR